MHGSPHRSYDPCMARTPSSDRFEIKGLTAEADERAGWVAVSPTEAIPTRFYIRANLARPDCDVVLLAVVGSDGEPKIKTAQVSVPMPGDAELTTSTMRGVLIHQLMKLAIEKVARPVRQRPDVRPGAFQLEGEPDNGFWVGPVPREGRGSQTPRDRIGEAARIYREAVGRGSRAPVKDVATIMHISASQVSRYLKAARQDGLLEDVPAPTPGPGRIVPATVEVNETPDERFIINAPMNQPFDRDEYFARTGTFIGTREEVLSEENRKAGDEASLPQRGIEDPSADGE